MSSPSLPDPPGSVYSRFPLDPRSQGDLRARDADREIARDILAEAYAQGQLTHDEYGHRLDTALEAHHLGQFVPLISDLVLQPGEASVRRPPLPATSSGGSGWLTRPANGVIRTALFVVGVTNLVWLWTCISSGRLLNYWPMWPALGMAIMVLAAMLFGKNHRRSDHGPGHHEGPRRRELE